MGLESKAEEKKYFKYFTKEGLETSGMTIGAAAGVGITLLAGTSIPLAIEYYKQNEPGFLAFSSFGTILGLALICCSYSYFHSKKRKVK